MNRYTPITGVYVAFGSCEKCQPGFRDEKRSKILGTSSGAKLGKQSKHGETKNFNFQAHHSFGNSYSCITADQWDAMMWKIQQGIMNCPAVAKRF